MIVHMIGNAHLQPAGMWSLNAGKDEALATLRAAVDRCEEFPLYRFSFGDVWAYKLAERLDPKLFKRIKKLVKRKQWSLFHGLYTLTNPETVSGEIWKHVVTSGQQFCFTHFGQTSEFAVNLEARSLPESYLDQLIDAGYKGLVYHGDPISFKGVESSVFRWENGRGGELLCYRITPSYRSRSSELYGQIMESVEAGSLTLGHTLCFYGIGDHGGGPSKGNIEYILEHKNAFEGSELKFSTLEEFFSDALLMSDSFPTHRGSIGVRKIGTFSTRQKQRKDRLLAEARLLQATRICDQYAPNKQLRGIHESLGLAWEDLMMSSSACFSNGSYIESNVDEVNRLVFGAYRSADDWLYSTSRTWVNQKLEDLNYQQILVFNSSDLDQDVWVEVEPHLDFDEWGNRCLCDESGDIIPVQLLRPEAPNEFLTRIVFRASLNARELKKYHLREFSLLEREEEGSPELDYEFRLLKTTLENSQLLLRYSSRALTRISTSENAAENVLGRLGMTFSIYEDHGDVAASGNDFFELPFSSAIKSDGWSVLENGPLKVVLINRGRLGGSGFEWTMSLYQNDDRIFHSFRINFQEEEKLLQLNIQLENNPLEWVDATSSGSIVRQSEKVERPFHGYTTAKTEKGDFSLLSRDIFSFSHHANSISFSLLRSTHVASDARVSDCLLENRGTFTDQGIHQFDFVVIPDSANHDMLHEYDQLIHKPYVMDRFEGLNRPLWGNLTPLRLQEMNEFRAKKDGKMTHLPS